MEKPFELVAINNCRSLFFLAHEKSPQKHFEQPFCCLNNLKIAKRRKINLEN